MVIIEHFKKLNKFSSTVILFICIGKHVSAPGVNAGGLPTPWNVDSETAAVAATRWTVEEHAPKICCTKLQHLVASYRWLAVRVLVSWGSLHPFGNKFSPALDDWGSIPGWMWEFFSSTPCPDRLWSPPSLLCKGYIGLFLWGKAAGAWSWPLTSI